MTKEQAQNALYIQNGACNPRAIARALTRSIDEDTHDSNSPPSAHTSPATRLILHQLIYILTGLDVAFSPLYNNLSNGWEEDTVACKEVSEKCASTPSV